MVDTKITDLTPKTTVVDTDEIVINDVAGGNVDKKEGLDDIKTYMSLSPTLVTPALGTPASGVLTNCTGLPLAGLTNAAKTQALIVSVSDETTVLTTGTAKTTFRMPYAFTLTEVRASLTTAGTGAALVTVDINEAGTTILSTKLTIDASETTSTTAATAAVISDSSLADDAEMTVDIVTIDTDNVAAGLKIYLIGYQT